ncbi:MAG: hypothetical protein JSV03_09810 [Planctomycetota bacterium]|nr:MAG: hypothetical protein JSV03_09810 [Planctomycetota bacterium]
MDRLDQCHKCFTLIEVLVVVAIIVLLITILLPSLASAREQARSASCGVLLKQIGVAGAGYANINRGWLVGSPNTSGNGTRPGFNAGAYTDTVNPKHYPAMHIFDWASPLLRFLSVRPPIDIQQRYAAAVDEVFGCPTNRRKAGPVNFPALKYLIPADASAPSYATSRHFMLVGKGAKTGKIRGKLWWSKDHVPTGYVPKLDRMRKPANKAFLADAHVVSKTKGQIANANWGFTSQGAWRSHDIGPVTYRGLFLRKQMWRHQGAINILAFDGHVQRLTEGDSLTRNGYGQGARKAQWWFPSGTKIIDLQDRGTNEPEDLVVP